MEYYNIKSNELNIWKIQGKKNNQKRGQKRTKPTESKI